MTARGHAASTLDGRSPAPGADDGTSMGFIGVSTAHSSIRRVFPAWAAVLGLPTATLVGYDVSPGAPPDRFRELVEGIREQPDRRGALVTTHKVSLYRAAGELFDDLDPLARTFGEVSSIYRRDGRLLGAARDPVTVRLALGDLLDPHHFADTGAEVLVLGSGGAGMALTHALGTREDRPARVTCTALEQGDLADLRELHARAELPEHLFRYALSRRTEQADALVAALPPGSLVVNATGLGKDHAGSPVGAAVVFPMRGVVWDFNYRGSLEFLGQARAGQESRELAVHDGWRYFVHGWSQVVADVFDIAMPSDTVAELARVAAASR